MNITILTSSNQGSIIYLLYSHNLHFLSPPLLHSTFRNSLLWVAPKYYIGWTLVSKTLLETICKAKQLLEEKLIPDSNIWQNISFAFFNLPGTNRHVTLWYIMQWSNHSLWNDSLVILRNFASFKCWLWLGTMWQHFKLIFAKIIY